MNQDCHNDTKLSFKYNTETTPTSHTKGCKVPALLQTCTHAYNIPTFINTTDTNKLWPHMTTQSTAVLMLQHKQLMFTYTHTCSLFFLLHVGVPTSWSLVARRGVNIFMFSKIEPRNWSLVGNTRWLLLEVVVNTSFTVLVFYTL